MSDPAADHDQDHDRGHGGDQARDEADPRVQSGLEHLQRAAHEMIAATRALLDVAEELVDDPRAAASVVDLLGSVTGRRHRGGGARPPGSGDDGDEPPVQRIPVS